MLGSMAEAPWVTIIGFGEDGPAGLARACQEALAEAEVILAPPRHLALIGPEFAAERIAWPVPFADGLPLLLGQRGRRVVVLASGDPFWFGAGSVIARHLEPDEWSAFPAPSTFSLIAARLGWPLERTVCLGLHAAPPQRLAPHLARGARLIALLRDGAAVRELAAFLVSEGFGASAVTICEAMGGPAERMTQARASHVPDADFRHPVAIAVAVDGPGTARPQTAGLPDTCFDHDGQITKRPLRALTLSALAPRPHEHLWDIGGGSGSIAIEWLLAHPSTTATSFERDSDRADRIEVNALKLGVDRLEVVRGVVPEALADTADPQAVFIGGGLSNALLTDLRGRLAPGTRLVANAVTLEAESLLAEWSQKLGGDLMRIEIAHAAPLGAKRGWNSAYPIVQWSVTL